MKAAMEWAVGTTVVLFFLFVTWLFVWVLGGMQPVVVGTWRYDVRDYIPTSAPYPTETPWPTVTPNPDAEILSCRFVQIPGNPVGADLCDMRDGETCLFDRGSLPTVCYPKPEATDER